MIPVYASHLRVRDTDGEPSTVCLLVRDHERAVLQTPAARAPPPRRPAAPTARAPTLRGLHRLPRPPDDLDGLLQRTVERARDMLDGDSAFLLLATDDETELEVRASTGLPSARQRFARVPVEGGPRPLRLRPHAGRPRGPHRRARARSPSSTAPACARSSPFR
ncbi:hypothetical protein GCM10019016_046500 [Streptomyces prasinosporus]|uniref:Uncharacterized protein n=1 Tax=Streptomyces prasinosporus TaxID=68256 RepID=A0ABP6TSW0_9ACTN